MSAGLAVACGGDDTGAPGAGAAGGSGMSGGAVGTAGTSGTMSSGAGGVSGNGSTTGSAQTGGPSGSAGTGGSAGSTGSATGVAATMDAGVDSATGTTSGVRQDAGGAQDATVGVRPDASVDPSKKITVWMAGDSTVMLCTGVCPCGWGSQFQPYLSANATVADAAVGGRSIQTWLYDPNVTTNMDATGECIVDPKTFSTRWQAMLDPVNGMKPGDYLFIEFGINDGDPTCNRHVGTALFQSYLTTMAQAATARGAQPIFVTSTSFMMCTGAAVTPNRGFGPQTMAAGAAGNVPVIDLTKLSAELYTTLGLCPNDLDFTSTTSAVGEFFCDDHTHFEAAGAVQIAGVIAKALRDQNIGLAAYLK